MTKHVGGRVVRVCTVADLIIHKVLPGRPVDELDLRFLVRRYGETLDRSGLERDIRNLADLLGQPEIHERYLAAWR